MSWRIRALALALAWSLLGMVNAGPARCGEGDPWTVVSWAPTGGSQALWYEALGGLKASVGMFNANGGIAGRQLTVAALTVDDESPGFQAELAAPLNRPGVLGVVGGVARGRAAEVADYLRQINQPWLGPWSDDRGLYRGEETDPFAVLPHSGQAMKALLSYVKQAFDSDPGRSGPVYLVFYNFPGDQEMAARARQTAAGLGLNLKRAPINPDFNNWPFLADYIDEARAVIIWLSQGHTAALVKAAKTRRPDALYLTSAVNATNRNLVVISGGAWNGMIFPAVLTPSQEIPVAYDGILRKYGPAGLDGGYQSYLGFAQGQILARALNLGAGQGSVNLARNLYDSQGFPTLLAYPVNYGPGRHDPPMFYLGRAYGNGHWEVAGGLSDGEAR